jgi:hypothetical protein
MFLTQCQSLGLGNQTANGLRFHVLLAFDSKLLVAIHAPTENLTGLIDGTSMLTADPHGRGEAREAGDGHRLILCRQ